MDEKILDGYREISEQEVFDIINSGWMYRWEAILVPSYGHPETWYDVAGYHWEHTDYKEPLDYATDSFWLECSSKNMSNDGTPIHNCFAVVKDENSEITDESLIIYYCKETDKFYVKK